MSWRASMPRERVATTREEAASAFATDLARLGIACEVDVREAVALVRAADERSADRFADPDVRHAVLTVGRTHGFARVALLIGDS